jgi:chorismate mutase
MAEPPRPSAIGPDAGVEAQLKEFRKRIDRLDEELVRLLNARASCANEIGRLKDQVGIETYQPSRELEVLKHVRTVNSGPLDGSAITRLFERIIDESRRLERLAHDGDA